MFSNLKTNTSGQAVVELALILPLFLLLVFGVIEMSRIGYSYLTLSNAVKNGARTASVGGVDSQVRNTIIQSAPLIDEDLITISIYPAEDLRVSGEQVVVNVSYPIDLTTPIIDQLIPNPIVINTSLAMRLE